MSIPGATVHIDLTQIRTNVATIASRTRVPVLAVVKADAYGLGAERVTEAISDRVEGWCTLTLDESIAARLSARTLKPTLALGPAEPDRLSDYISHNVTPAVATVEQAIALRQARPALNVDTGMQRFACLPSQVEAMLATRTCSQAFTHATRLDHVDQLLAAVGDRGLRLHAAATSLLEHRKSWLDAVRPGLAMYIDAVRVTAPLVEVRETSGHLGYTALHTRRHGVIAVGYANGLRPGPCMVHNQPTRLPEVGMQTAYVDLSEIDADVGDEVVLLGDTLWTYDIARDWHTSPQEVLLGLSRVGPRVYRA